VPLLGGSLGSSGLYNLAFYLLRVDCFSVLCGDGCGCSVPSEFWIVEWFGFLFWVVFWVGLGWVAWFFRAVSMLDGWDGDGYCIGVDRFFSHCFLNRELICGCLQLR
jgi:hypothetical protein